MHSFFYNRRVRFYLVTVFLGYFFLAESCMYKHPKGKSLQRRTAVPTIAHRPFILPIHNKPSDLIKVVSWADN